MKKWDRSIIIGGWSNEQKNEVYKQLIENFGQPGEKYTGFFDLHVEAILMDEDVYTWIATWVALKWQ